MASTPPVGPADLAPADLAPADLARPRVGFILSALRSGSTWLNLVLGSHDWAMNLGEYYRPFRFPGHIACRLCEAEGRAECSVLHGIERVPAARAFHFAAARAGRGVLIDASKQLDWCGEFLGRDDLDVRLIHLVRNPCGHAESELRRHPGRGLDEVLASWEAANRAIENFIAASSAPAMLAGYDDLAANPGGHFPALCGFLGHGWQPAALRYWEVAHHGLGGNGAAAPYLKGRLVTNFATFDDAHYDGIERRPTAPDLRWRERLGAAERARALGLPYAVALRRRLGGDWPGV